MILLTGASGFVGRAVWARLEKLGPVRLALRNPDSIGLLKGVEFAKASLSPDEDWTGALAGASVVIHCAARVHVMKEAEVDPLAEFRLINVDGTLRLARQAADAGARRFIFISSIGVNGGETFAQPFTAGDDPAPHTPYAVSKREAEAGLRTLAAEKGMEVVIIRPPLVYGPSAPGNFSSLMKWLTSGIPLPLGGITENRRSFVFLDNLVDLIVTCIDHPAAANQTFLVSDDEDLSTAALLRRMAAALGRPARLIPVPAGLITLGGKLIGRPGIAQRLCGSLQVDIGKTKALLGWSPPISVDEGLRRTAEHWLATERLPDTT